MANNNHKKSKKKRWFLIGGAAVVLILIVLGVSGMLRSNHTIDPSKLSSVEKGDLARSVVATGKVEPLAKVEVKSKASGM
jgi:HlyD family secretion protein